MDAKTILIRALNVFKKTYFSIVLLGCGTKVPDFFKFLQLPQTGYELGLEEKAQYFAKLMFTFTPIAYLLDSFNLWFPNNEVFFRTIVFAVGANIFFGGWYHWRNNTFKLKILLLKNLEMCFIIILSYPILEGINTLTGDNLAGNIFKWAIQIGTILYPGSKALKNAHLLSNKKYPPEFLMNRIYNFEKDGDVNDLLGKDKAEEILKEE